jgi:glycosyltransferase involved in cell wall biosynthesis
LLVSGPDVSEIHNATVNILRNQALAKKLGEAGRKRVLDNFSAEGMVEGMISVYEESLRHGV